VCRGRSELTSLRGLGKPAAVAIIVVATLLALNALVSANRFSAAPAASGAQDCSAGYAALLGCLRPPLSGRALPAH
jgi:hypothetical protein